MKIVLCVLISVSLIAAVILIALSRVSLETYQNGSSLDAKQDQKMSMFHDNECKTEQLTHNSFSEFMMGGSLGFLTFELVHWLTHKPNITNTI